MTLMLVGVVVCVLLAVAVMLPPKGPRRTPAAAIQAALTPVVQQPARFSIREQALEEDAAALAAEFRRAKYEQYLADLRAEASAAFARPAG